MNKFDKDKPCPKCGDNNLSHNLRQAGQRLDSDWMCYERTDIEVIRTYCRTCGHKWSSLPLDAIVIGCWTVTNFNTPPSSYYGTVTTHFDSGETLTL